MVLKYRDHCTSRLLQNTGNIVYLIPPVIDDRHVDVINEDDHLSPPWWAIRAPHPLVYIALHSTLGWKENDYGRITV